MIHRLLTIYAVDDVPDGAYDDSTVVTETAKNIARSIAFVVDFIISVAVATMAWKCAGGGVWAFPIAVLAFVFAPFFLVYYLLVGSPCAWSSIVN